MSVDSGAVLPSSLVLNYSPKVLFLWLSKAIIEFNGVEVKRLVTVVILAILLVGLVLLGISDTNIAIADTSIPNDEVASSVSTASNSSASATTTTTMYTGDE